MVEKVIEGAYEVVGFFDRIEEKRDAMQLLVLPPPARQALAQAALTYRYGDEHQPVTTADILTRRRREDYGQDLWSRLISDHSGEYAERRDFRPQCKRKAYPHPCHSQTSTPILSSTAHCG
ncbi:hypothetical protein ACO2XV_17985 [Escherichia coli]